VCDRPPRTPRRSGPYPVPTVAVPGSGSRRLDEVDLRVDRPYQPEMTVISQSSRENEGGEPADEQGGAERQRGAAVDPL
jgi:hypothetical protein